MTKRVAIYARVSTSEKDDDNNPSKGQTPENQLIELRTWCERVGHQIVDEYVEHESGRKGENARREFARLMQDAARRQFDLVLFWSLDRFSREGMAQTIHYLRRLESHGVGFHSYTEEYLTTDNELARDILLAVMSSLAKAEAVKISDRTKAGLARTRAKGTKLGRPRLPEATRVKICKLRQADPKRSIRSISRELKVPYETVRQTLKN